jgi:hypothetical protein
MATVAAGTARPMELAPQLIAGRLRGGYILAPGRTEVVQGHGKLENESGEFWLILGPCASSHHEVTLD